MTTLKQILERQEREFAQKFQPTSVPYPRAGGEVDMRLVKFRRSTRKTQERHLEEMRSHILQDKLELLEAVENEYKKIFAWLLGESGDFPDLSQKPHYRFRTELRERLAKLKN